MAYDPDGQQVGARIGTRRPTADEWSDPSADEAIGVQQVSRMFRPLTDKKEQHTMTSYAQVSPDLSLDDFALADLLGDLNPIEDEAMVDLFRYASGMPGHRIVTLPGGERLLVSELPDPADADALHLELSTSWRALTAEKAKHLDEERRNAGKVQWAWWTVDDETYNAAVFTAQQDHDVPVLTVVTHRVEGGDWVPLFYGDAAKGVAEKLTQVRNADRGTTAERFGLAGERVLIQSFEDGEDRKGRPQHTPEAYRVVNVTEDSVGMMRKAHRLAATAKARAAGFDVPEVHADQD